MSWSDPYFVLKVARGSSDIDVKRAYRRALLQHHPDKQRSQPAHGNKTKSLITIDDINKAYRQICLQMGSVNSTNSSSDATDEALQFNETVDLSDFTESELPNGSIQWVRDCRCGDSGYVLQEEELYMNGDDADEIAVQCAGCSLWILVQYASE